MAGPKKRAANAGGSQAGSQSSKAASQASWSASDRNGALGEVKYAMEQVQYLIFGVGLIVSKDLHRTLRWRIVDQVLHYLAIIALPLSVFWWGYNDHPRHTQDWGGPFKPVHRYLVHIVKFEGMDFKDFQPIWATAVAVVLASVLNMAYVGYAFRTHRFRFKFPLRFLRLAGHVVPLVLYVPGLAILLEPFDCPWGSSDDTATPHVSFPAVWTCWTGKHNVYVAISVIALFFLVGQSVLAVMFFYETDPYKKGCFTARAHARSELVYLLATFLNVLCLEITAIPHMAIGLIGVACGVACLYSVFIYYAFYRLWVNRLRAAVFSAYTWIFLLVFIEGRYLDVLRAGADPAAWVAVMILGCLPTAGLGWWLSGWHFRRHLCTGRVFGLELASAWHVEVATRFLYEDQSPAAAGIAEQIYQRGLEAHEHSAAVRVCYGRHLLKYSENGQAGYRAFEDAGKFGPFFDVRFQVFRAAQERIQASQGTAIAGQGRRKHVNESEELIEHLEFQKDMAGAKKYHKSAVRAFRKFWGALMAEDVTLPKLESCVKAIDDAESRASMHYKALIARHPNQPRILRSYGQFHEEVLNDLPAAQDLYDAADEFEETMGAQFKKDALRLDEDLGSEDAGSEAAGRAGGDDDSARQAGGGSSDGGGGGGGRTSPPPLNGPRSPLEIAAAAQMAAQVVQLPTGKAPLKRSGSSIRFAVGPEGPASPPKNPAPAPIPEASPAPSPVPDPGVDRRGSVAEERRGSMVGGHPGRRSSVRSVENWLAGGAHGSPRTSQKAPQVEENRRSSTVMVQAVLAVDAALAVKDADPQFGIVFGAPADKARGAALGDFVRATEGTEPSQDSNPVARALGFRAGESRAAVDIITSGGGRVPALATLAPRSESPDGTYTLTVQRVMNEAAAAGAPTAAAPAVAPLSMQSLESLAKGVRMASKEPPSEAGGAKKKATLTFAALQLGQLGGASENRSAPAESSRGGMASDRPERSERSEGGDEEGADKPKRGRRPSMASGARAGGGDEDGMSLNSAAAHSKWARKMGRIKRRLALAAGQDHSIDRMKKTVFAVIATLAGLAIVCYVLMQNLIENYWTGIVRVGTGGQRRLSAVQIAVYSVLFVTSGLPGWDPKGDLESIARERLAAALNRLEEVHIGLRDVDPQMDLDLEVVITDAGKVATEPGNEYDMTFELVDAGRELLKWKPADLRAAYPEAAVNPFYHFLSVNGPDAAYKRYIASNLLEQQRAFSLFSNMRVFVICMVVMATVICVTLAVFFFRPKVNAVQKEKEDAIRLFFDIPKNMMHRIARANKSHRSDEDEDEDEELEFDSDDDFMAPRQNADKKKAAAAGEKDTDAEWKKALGDSAIGMTREEMHKARRIHRAFRRDRRRLDGLTLRYILAFLGLFVGFLAWFIVAFTGSERCMHFTAERNQGGLRRSLAWQVFFHATQLIADHSGALGGGEQTPEMLATNRKELMDMVDWLEETCRHLLYGNEEDDLVPQAGRYGPRDVQMFGTPCQQHHDTCEVVPGVPASNGLHRYVNEFLEEARMLARSHESTYTPDNMHYEFIRDAVHGIGALETMNVAANKISEQEAEMMLQDYLQSQQMMLGIVIAVIVLSYLAAFRVIIARVQDDARRTMFLLLMIPNEVLESVDTIRQHLIRKAFAARDQTV